MGVYLREKKMSGGQVSFYLDIYHNKARWYEFIGIHINKTHPSPEDKEKKRLAQEIRVKRENELIVQDNGLIDKSKRKRDFIKWFENYINAKTKKNTHQSTTLAHLKKYMGNRPLPFTAISPEWIKGFTKYIQGFVSNNTNRLYLMDIFSSLEDAMRQDIINKNPFRLIPRHERVKQMDTYRHAYSLQQLQKLAI